MPHFHIPIMLTSHFMCTNLSHGEHWCASRCWFSPTRHNYIWRHALALTSPWLIASKPSRWSCRISICSSSLECTRLPLYTCSWICATVNSKYRTNEGLPPSAIFEFGRGFYGNAYSPVLSGLTLTPGPCRSFVTVSDGKLGGAWERGRTALYECKFLAIETFIIWWW